MAGFGALRKLLEAVRAGHTPLDESRDIGRRFAEVPPEVYHKRATRPAHTADEAEYLYRVGLDVDDAGITVTDPDIPGFEIFSVPVPRREALIKASPQVRRVLQDLDPSTDLNMIDALGSVPGMGFGKRAYGALFDLMPGTNFSEGLTGINNVRRSFNTADTLLRNPAMSSRIIPEASQLQDLGMEPMGYMLGADDYQKIGAMLLGGGGRALHRIDKELGGPDRGIGVGTLRRLQIMDDMLRGETVPDERFRSLGYRAGGSVRRSR